MNKLNCIWCTVALGWMIFISGCAPLPMRDALSVADSNPGSSVGFVDNGKQYTILRLK